MSDEIKPPHPWSRPFSPNAPRFPNREQRTADSIERAGQVTGNLERRRHLYARIDARRRKRPVQTTSPPDQYPTPLIQTDAFMEASDPKA